MQNAKRSLLLSALTLGAWFLTACRPACVAQDAVRSFPTATDNTSNRPAPEPETDFAADITWGTAVPESPAPSLTQRVARLARGRTQLEGGYSFLYDAAGGRAGTQHAFPDLLLRFGLTDRLELRLGWPGYVANDFDDPALGGEHGDILDPNVGLVYDLWPQRGLLPQAAVHVAVPVPLEGNPFTLNSLQPLAELMYAWQTSERTVLTGRSGFAMFDVAGDKYTQFQQSITLDVFLTRRLGTFVSWEMLADHGAWNDASQHLASGGLSFLLTENFAVSWRSGVGLNAVAPDFVTDIRFAYRF